MTNEIVRQLLEQGGMYSLDKPIGDMRSIIDTRYGAYSYPFIMLHYSSGPFKSISSNLKKDCEDSLSKHDVPAVLWQL